MNNFDDRAGAIRECRRVAKSGATIALTTNLQGHMKEFYAVFEEVLDDAGAREARRRLREHVDHRATVASVRELLEHCDFSITRVVEKAACMRFANGAALLRHHFIKLGFLDAWKKVVPDHQAEIFLSLERKLNGIAMQYGDLHLTIPMAYVEAVAV